MKLCFNQIESSNNLLKSSFNFFFLRFNLLKQGFNFPSCGICNAALYYYYKDSLQAKRQSL